MKRLKLNCNRCKAFYWETATPEPYHCYLGYKIDQNNAKPLTGCPKPTTITEFLKIKGLS